MREPLRFGLVGRGWRAERYLRIAQRLPQRFVCDGVVTRSDQAAAKIEGRWGVPTHRSVSDLLRWATPDVVVTSVAPAANPSILSELVDWGVHVLSETPPAATPEELDRLWAAVGRADKVQVAEQHPFLPHMAAVRELVRAGLIGVPSSAAVSWTHDYHAVAILRAMLRPEMGQVRVHAVRHQEPLMSGPDRGGWTNSSARPSAHVSAIVDFGAVIGTYDFTDGQWFNPLRPRSLTLRASRGLVADRSVVRHLGGTDIGRSSLERRNLGEDGNLEGFDLDSISHEGAILYRNPYRGARLSDEEIAIASCLAATARWAADEGPPPYPLADACEDQAIALAIHRAADEGVPVVVSPGAWKPR